MNAECHRLLDGFRKNVRPSETLRAMYEIRSVVKTPEWQKARAWQVSSAIV